MLTPISIINELEEALNSGSPEKRLTTLRRVTDFFLNQADQLSEEQITVFDDVLVHLVQRIEAKARTEFRAVNARQSSHDGERFQKRFDEQAAQLNIAFSHISQGVVMFDSSARLVLCNDKYRQLYGLPQELTKPGCALEQIIRRRVADRTLPGAADDFVRDLLTKIAKGEIEQHEITLDNGRIISIKNEPLPCGGWVATHEDITDKRRAALELDETKIFLDSIIQHAPIAILVKDAKSRQFVLANRALEETLAVSGAWLIGKDVFDVYPKEYAEPMDRADRECLQNSVGIVHGEFTADNPRLGMRILNTKRFVIRDSNREAKYLVLVIDDITERRISEQQIKFMAHHDALTGLLNRTSIIETIDEAAARLRGGGAPFSVLMLDLDRFKQVNDTLGHSAGDALLREAATRLKVSLRENDIIARLGGDEFAVVQTNEDNQREAAHALANRIAEIIAAPFIIDGNEVNIATSIGISLAPEHATNPDDLLKMADLALYSAKSAGRSQSYFFNPEMSEVANARQELESELRQAILHDELELHYQPIVDTETRKIRAAEALIRWQHPVRGTILPDRFIPLAEETGLIAQIGEWVLQAACRDAACWPPEVAVSVNLSAIQFYKSNLSDVVMYALAESGLPPERLELEITETALIERGTECLPALRQFKNLGISIALDDFGTGYSSLSQLIVFPFDKIKIDKTFIQNITKRSECTAIISAAHTLAQNLDMAVTAEGVETIEQFQLLRLMGITSLQGYLFKGPGPVTELDFNKIYGDRELEDVA